MGVATACGGSTFATAGTTGVETPLACRLVRSRNKIDTCFSLPSAGISHRISGGYLLSGFSRLA